MIELFIVALMILYWTGDPSQVAAPLPSAPPDFEALLARQVAPCWVPLSPDHPPIGVTVLLQPSGRPFVGAIRFSDPALVALEAARQSLVAARAAIAECGADGFDLPAQHFTQWRSLELTLGNDGVQAR